MMENLIKALEEACWTVTTNDKTFKHFVWEGIHVDLYYDECVKKTYMEMTGGALDVAELMLFVNIANYMDKDNM